jgi:hypothetical protein
MVKLLMHQERRCSMTKVQTTKQEEEAKLSACVARESLLDKAVRALKAEQKAKEGALQAALGKFGETLALAELGEIDPEMVETERLAIRALRTRIAEIPFAVQGLQAMEKENFKTRTRAQNRLNKFQAEEDYNQALAGLQAEVEAGRWDRELEGDLFMAAADAGKNRREIEDIVQGLKTTYEQRAFAERRG